MPKVLRLSYKWYQKSVEVHYSSLLINIMISWRGVCFALSHFPIMEPSPFTSPMLELSILKHFSKTTHLNTLIPHTVTSSHNQVFHYECHQREFEWWSRTLPPPNLACIMADFECGSGGTAVNIFCFLEVVGSHVEQTHIDLKSSPLWNMELNEDVDKSHFGKFL